MVLLALLPGAPLLAFGITPDEQICLEHYYQRFRVSSEVGPFMPRLVFSGMKYGDPPLICQIQFDVLI
jgi:hypothetical protein